jgi:acyl dehydratase
MTTASKTFIFGKEDVRIWCKRSGDQNRLHLAEAAVNDTELFTGSGVIVPGAMLLDKVSGLLTKWSDEADKSGSPILCGFEDIKFSRPLYTNEQIQITVTGTLSQPNNTTGLTFEGRSTQSDEIYFNGFAHITHS